jgi:hypothetical protein
MADLRQVLAFATSLYLARSGVAYAGYVRRDPMSQIQLRPGRVNPYAIYDRLRAQGTLVPTRLGNWVTTSHRVCDSVPVRGRRAAPR